MERPYIICHILSALDGKIEGAFMNSEINGIVSKEYGRIRTEMDGNAWLYGTNTTKEFTNFNKPDLTNTTNVIDNDDFVTAPKVDLYYISIDVAGEIGWDSEILKMKGKPDSQVIEVLIENTSKAYRSYLRKLGISYIIAGKDTLDCKLAVEKLYRLFGIKKLLICGGGIINWSFLQQGIVDELSLVLSPVADGNPDSVTVFEKLSSLPDSDPIEFTLKNIERINGDGIHLNYLVKNKSV